MLACRGIPVTLYEMRPQATTPAHRTDGLAEVVCSNSFGADSTTSPAGILKEELRGLGSLILKCADAARVPAGKALAVDRDIFSRLVTETLEKHPLVTVVREECVSVPEGPVILATGPLTSPAMAGEIRRMAGEDYLSFFDAVAPVVEADSIDMTKAFRLGRWGQEDDYINCPFTREEYEAFISALTGAERTLPPISRTRPPGSRGAFPWRLWPPGERTPSGSAPCGPWAFPSPERGKKPGQWPSSGRTTGKVPSTIS